jgi:predicted DNA-binding transcriptional regulator YafY
MDETLDAMSETAGRLLTLLAFLQTRRDWSGADLAQHLEVTPRTVRRDVEKLRALGYPVHASPGVAGGYRLGAGAALPPLLLDDDEAVAVAVGLRTAAVGGVSGIEETSVRALAKLEQMLPARLRDRVNALQSVTVPMSTGWATVDADTLTLLATACRDHLRLRVDYRPADGEVGRRSLEPHRIVHSGHRWYLVAYDLDRADWRTFRVDRLTPVPPLRARFTPREPPAEDAARYTSWNVSNAVYRYQARITMHAPAAAVRERVTPTAAMVEPIDEHSCELRSGSNSLDALSIYIGLLGFEMTVHEPPELVDTMRTLGERLRRATSVAASQSRAGSSPARSSGRPDRTRPAGSPAPPPAP